MACQIKSLISDGRLLFVFDLFTKWKIRDITRRHVSSLRQTHKKILRVKSSLTAQVRWCDKHLYMTNWNTTLLRNKSALFSYSMANTFFAPQSPEYILRGRAFRLLFGQLSPNIFKVAAARGEGGSWPIPDQCLSVLGKVTISVTSPPRFESFR